jgi:hypothetical protein
MSYGRVFETIDREAQEIDVSELLRRGAEVARDNARTYGLTAEFAPNQGFGDSDKLNVCVIKIINNLLNTYNNYT